MHDSNGNLCLSFYLYAMYAIYTASSPSATTTGYNASLIVTIDK